MCCAHIHIIVHMNAYLHIHSFLVAQLNILSGEPAFALKSNSRIFLSCFLWFLVL